MTREQALIFSQVLQSSKIPLLHLCDYKTAQTNHAFLVARDTLTKLGYTPRQASRLAGRKGSATQRIESALGEL